MLSRNLSRASSKQGASKRLYDALRSLDKTGRGTLTIEALQQGLVALDLVPNASNDELLNLFRSCDLEGNGSIDYKMFAAQLQAREAQGKQLLVPGFRGASARAPARATPGSLQTAVRQRLHIKHGMLRESLQAVDEAKTGKVPLSTLKAVLKDLNVVTKEQLASGELDAFFSQHVANGQVDYARFVDGVKQQDLAQLDSFK